MGERYFYHSFPRRTEGQDVNAKGLSILRSLAASGLLLTPEKTVWSEFTNDGGRAQPVEVFQKRACFTELAPTELSGHASLFGPFTIEFEIETLRLLGAIPVFYLPSPGTEERGLGGVSAALIARMAEIQQVLSRLAAIRQLTAATTNKEERIQVTVNGTSAGTTQCSIAAAEDLLNCGR